MNQQRRTLMQMTALVGLMASAGLMTQAEAAAWNEAAFKAKSVEDVAKVLGSSGMPEVSDKVMVRAPDIAENGAVVPVGVESSLKATEMAILVEKNPSALAAMFILPEGAESFATTRVKMGQTSNVFALVKSDGKWYMASKEVKVTLGGCGG
ncbi:MAG: thiosulfate oxidation carrier protein SoxY [Burkholderiaceae bacterium]|nr:thiosulfate oxidation carrier protein SoxY [Burkholderiaceae bacterium]MCD8517459.1 thiosulfate oxidation carrier protein SoxY [Burkholderiaceae bacterium]MCD8537848.1 thiosulfate oxidation carrier protein SoxY [Burkholderiaceae bacterium]MCD8566132.1 thiosulfate oxidation carrier protein SoxY [Burkholderiaceae bacterium]